MATEVNKDRTPGGGGGFKGSGHIDKKQCNRCQHNNNQ